MKQIDHTAARLGIAMRDARRTTFIPIDVICNLLKITPGELYEYETGIKPIPHDMLQHIVFMSYKMLHVRALDALYRKHQTIFNKLRKNCDVK